MRVFDELIANTDRNLGNMLIDREWKLWLIDHSRAFRLQETLRSPLHVRRCDRALLMQMKALTREAVDEELGDYLTSAERKALLARRDVLVTVGRVTRADDDALLRTMRAIVPPIAATSPRSAVRCTAGFRGIIDALLGVCRRSALTSSPEPR